MSRSHRDIGTPSWIEATPGVYGGEPCIRNTRHTVAGLVQWQRLGLTDDRILSQHPDLSQDDLNVAWQYYEKHTAEIDEEIRDDAEALGPVTAVATESRALDSMAPARHVGIFGRPMSDRPSDFPQKRSPA
ncbi:MAG: DUF433 domain-containing protein [Pirellulales bacterium]|nr:DUF433 domain-containing protein [Pirellulales bacterium]